MFCTQCGKEVGSGNLFCGNCGSEALQTAQNEKIVVSDNPLKDVPKVDESKKEKKSNSIIAQLASIGGFVVALVVGRFLGLITFVFLGAFLIGQWFPIWYLKRQSVNLTLIKWMSWSNVIAWLLPPLGLMMSTATFGFSNLIEQESKKYKILAIVGLALSLINAIVGVLTNM